MSHVIGLLSSPDVREKSHEIAFDYATDLISEEIKSNLQISQSIKINLGLQRLNAWVDYVNSAQRPDLFEITVGGLQKVGINSDRLKGIINYTSDEALIHVLTSEPPIIKSGKDVLEKFGRGKIHLNIKENTYLSHESLSAIECKRRDVLSLKPDSPAPTVKQGSILKKDDSFYICMQPLCDSVRVRENTNFIFLKIDIITDNKQFTHVLRNPLGGFIKFNIKPLSKDIYIFKLKPNPDTNTIKTEFIDGCHMVIHDRGNNEFENLTWVGELKSNIAQSIANKLAEQISRVGLDTNEWLRLSASSR
ncbi:hypothetical protein DZS_12820 [Dickeya ananatis]